jgi:AraC-like DNA-binding protein
MAVFIYTVGYLGFRQPEIFNGSVSDNGKKQEVKYARSSLKEEQAKAHLDKLLSVMETEKPYLDSNLKIQHLSEKVGVSSHHLSQIINENLNQNYADFINSYRINEAKRLLLSPEYELEKILSIAFDAGFQNKATFNASFKKYTGMSPTEYKKYQQKVLVN